MLGGERIPNLATGQGSEVAALGTILMVGVLTRCRHPNAASVSDQISPPRTGVGGFMVFYTALEAATERARLESLGYVVTAAPLPFDDRETQPPGSARDGFED